MDTKDNCEFVKEILIDEDGDNSPSNLMKINESSNFKLGTGGRIYDCVVNDLHIECI